MAEKCYRCGAVSDVPGVFVKTHRSFRLGVYNCCRPCLAKAEPSEQSMRKWVFPLYFLMAGVGLLFLLVPALARDGWLLLNLFFFQMFMVATIWPHELGHAWAGRALGLRVFKIYLGFGKTLFTHTVFGFETEFRSIPLGGVVLATHREKTRIRRRQFGYVLAGPAVNFLLAAVVLLFIPWEQLWRFEALRQGLAPGQVFLYSNLFVLVVNLWPRNIMTPLGKTPSDGKSLWLALFGKQDPDAKHAQWFLLEGVMLWASEKPAEAIEWFDRGLALYPKNLGLLTQRVNCLCSLQRREEYREGLLQLLARDDVPASSRPNWLNDVAYMDAVLGREELLQEADRCSLEAMAALSWNPAVKGTRGAVLVLLGRIQEGLPLLRESLAETDYVQGQAENHCWLAMGHARLGELDEARKHVMEARRLQPDCFLLERAEREPVSQ